jgi:predicted metal-dependent peptidase
MESTLKISRCSYRMMCDYPFFGSCLLQSKLHRDDKICTMCTNSDWIKWSGPFVDSISEDEALGVLAHEVMHVVLKHTTRRGERDPKKWNVACDYAVNPILKKEGFVLPEGALFDIQYENMAAEKIYNLIPDGEEPPEWGQFEDAGETAAEDQEAEARIDQMVATAVTQAANRGEVPDFAKSMVKIMENGQVDWEEKMRRLVGGDNPDEYSMRRINRKFYYQDDMYIPTVENRGIGNVVVYLDSSASVTDKMHSMFLGGINNMLNDLNPKSITVITCDTHVNSVQTFDQSQPIEAFKVNSRGGTNVAPVFKYIEDNQLEVDHFIGLTDLEIWDWPSNPPVYPMLWVAPVNSTETAPYGEIAHIKS